MSFNHLLSFHSNAAKQSWFMVVSELIEFSLKSITEISMQAQNMHTYWTFNLRGHSIITWTRWWGSKNVCFCPRTGHKNCPRRSGWVKKRQISVHVVVEPPKQKKWIFISRTLSYLDSYMYVQSKSVIFVYGRNVTKVCTYPESIIQRIFTSLL